MSFLLKNAWDSLIFHKKRSMLSIVLIAVASAAILLYRGFVLYTEQGLALTFIEQSGHIQVAPKGAWDAGAAGDMFLYERDMQAISAVCAALPSVKTADSVLTFQGIMGTETTSSVFWAVCYDNPHTIGVTEGMPVFAEDSALVLGKGLFEALHLPNVQEPYINMMTSIGQSGILTGSFDINGFIDTGIPQNDRGLVVASRAAMRDFFGIADSASYMRLFLRSDSDTEAVQQALQTYFHEHQLPFETRTWKALNPSWEQISGLFNTQSLVISVILCILIFVSLTQSLSASFMERIGEFGTMEALGMKKSVVVQLLVMEVFLLTAAGIAGGIVLADAGNVLTELFDIQMIPPGYSKGYRLQFYITAQSMFVTQCFIFLTSIIAVIYPVVMVRSRSTLTLMRYSVH